jgi:hypothetical protein
MNIVLEENKKTMDRISEVRKHIASLPLADRAAANYELVEAFQAGFDKLAKAEAGIPVYHVLNDRLKEIEDCYCSVS